MSSIAPRLSPDFQRLGAAIHRAAPNSYLVGGAIRDLLDNRTPRDLDVSTTADAQSVARSLAGDLGASFFPLDVERRVWRLVLPSGGPVSEIDISTFDNSIEADLRRRDFTLNAIAASLTADGQLAELIDPTHGISDLNARRLRMVSEDALRDDSLRLLRAVRIAIELDLSIETGTAAAIRDLAPTIHLAAPERQRDELTRIFATDRAADGIRLMDSVGLLSQLMPELDQARGVEQPANHHFYDVFNHSIEALASLDAMLATDNTDTDRPGWFGDGFREIMQPFSLNEYLNERTGGSTNRVLLKLAGLLHDVAKPETKSTGEDGRTHFFGHSEQGADKARAICSRLRFGNRETEYVAALIEAHLRPFQLSNGGPPSQRAIYKFFRDLQDAAPGCLVLSLADASAAMGPRLEPDRWRNRVAYIAYVLARGLEQRDTIERKPRLVTGHDLQSELNLTPGPLLGRIMTSIEEALATGQITSRAEAIDLARGMLEEPTSVLNKIRRAIQETPASPSPSAERGTEGERFQP